MKALHVFSNAWAICNLLLYEFYMLEVKRQRHWKLKELQNAESEVWNAADLEDVLIWLKIMCKVMVMESFVDPLIAWM